MSRYYDDDEDDDPYTPRIGQAAMPSPRSKYAPYYSGHANTFEDFLEEFEGRAYDCALTDPQRVDVIIRYVAPSLRDFWRSLSGYHSRDWPQLRQSLVNVFGSTTPRPQVMRQRLLSYVQDSSRKRMDREDDVLQYYRQFLCYSAPLVHASHLTKEDRNAAFWYGFHPEDREVLWPRLLGKNPFQPSDVPFHFEDIFVCARGAFAYGNPFPPWLHEQQFQSLTVRCERPVAKHGSRDTYGPQEMSRAVTSNAETTGNLDELPSPPQLTPHPQFPSSSYSASESQHGLAHSATLDQPGPAPTLSTTLRPSASSPSHTSSPVHLATDNDLIPAYTFPITTSTLLPSVSPTPSHDSSLAHSAADENPESMFPSPSIMPAPFSIPMSDFEYLPSVTVDQPEPIPTLLSTPPSSSISSTFLLSPARLATEHQSEPEPVPALFASVPTLPFAPSHVRSTADNDSIFTSTPPSSSPTSSTFVPFPVRSAMNNQPESEHEAASTVLLLSLPLSTLHPLSPLSSTSLPSLVTSATDDQPEPESMSVSVISTKLELSPHALPFPPDQKLDLPPRALSPPPDWLLVPSSTLSSSPLQEISSLGSGPLASPSPDQPLSLSESLSQLSRPCELESSTLVSAADVVTLSHLELPLSPGEPVLFLPSSLDALLNAPISPHLTLSQRTPGLETFDSDSSPPEIAPVPVNLAPSPSTFILLPVFPASSDLPSASLFSSFVLGPGLESSTVNIAPRSSLESSLSLLCEPVLHLPSPLELIPPHSLPSRRLSGVMSTSPVSTPLEVYEAPSVMSPGPALALRPSLFHSSGSLRRTPARFGFALALVTMAVLISTFLNISATVSTFAHKYWSKQEDISNSQNGTFKTSNSCNHFTQRLRLGQLTPCAPRLVFDPGGQPSSSSFKLLSAHEDACQRKLKTRNDFITHVAIPLPIPTDNLTVFDPGGSVIAPDLGTRRRSQTQLEVEDIISSPSPCSTPASFIPVSTLDDLIVFNSGGGAFCKS